MVGGAIAVAGFTPCIVVVLFILFCILPSGPTILHESSIFSSLPFSFSLFPSLRFLLTYNYILLLLMCHMMGREIERVSKGSGDGGSVVALMMTVDAFVLGVFLLKKCSLLLLLLRDVDDLFFSDFFSFVLSSLFGKSFCCRRRSVVAVVVVVVQTSVILITRLLL